MDQARPGEADQASLGTEAVQSKEMQLVELGSRRLVAHWREGQVSTHNCGSRYN